MGRIIKEIMIQGQRAAALFDTGAYHTYVLKNFVQGAPSVKVRKPYKVAIGGKTHTVKEEHFISGKIEGCDFTAEAIAVSHLGQAEGRKLDALIGALLMEKWEIKLDPKSGALGLEGLKRREFTEF